VIDQHRSYMAFVRCTLAATVLLISAVCAGANLSDPLADSGQCIVVITDSWSAKHGVLHTFERKNGPRWQERGDRASVVVGRAGLGWGRGDVDRVGFLAPQKREGDDKAPAGIFRLGTAFGYAARPVVTRMPYLHLSKHIVGVNDTNSRYYNRLVDVTTIPRPDWSSAETMVLPDNRYKWGIVLLHNSQAVPGAGSCIFLHVWKDESTATSGCTAMPEPVMIRLLQWLDAAKRPRLVQLPRSIYSEFRSKWRLPDT
jgi:zinc D-Ala-D-Ala dipeptidase